MRECATETDVETKNSRANETATTSDNLEQQKPSATDKNWEQERELAQVNQGQTRHSKIHLRTIQKGFDLRAPL